MKQSILIAIIGFGICVSADADVWKWIDAYGETHYVDTNVPIYTWLDEYGKVHFSDKPGHEDAVSVMLVWHSTGDLEESPEAAKQTKKRDNAYPGETEAEREERENAEAYYCKRAEAIYNSYLNAPRLYKTSDSGERVYLSDEESATTLEETKARVVELCE